MESTHASNTFVVGDVTEESLPAVKAFLEAHSDTSVFLLDGLTAFGPRVGEHPLSGNYRSIADRSGIVAVCCLTRKGDLLVQTGRRSDLAEVILGACARDAIRPTGIVAEWTAAHSIWRTWLQDGRVRPAYESCKLVYGLTLTASDRAGRRAPVSDRVTRRLSLEEFDVWDPLYTAQMKEEGAPVANNRDRRRAGIGRIATAGHIWGTFEGPDLATMVVLNAAYKSIGQIAGLYTRPDKRGRGFAREIMTRVLHECSRDYGLARIVLFVNDHNAAARGLYESMGFAACDHFGFLFGS